MTLRNLKLYIEVYKTMSITKAAENLHMTQPTVTRAIHETEEYYNVKLFDRINKRLKPTEAGDKFFYYATKAVEAFEHVEGEMLELNENETIRVGATIGMGSVILPPLVSEFKKKYPKVIVKSIVSNNATIEQKLLDNQIDFAMMEGYVPKKHVRCESFYKDKLVLLLPPDDPRGKLKSISLQELKNDSFLLREKGTSGRNYMDVLFNAHGLPIEPTMESASTHAIVRAVHAGLGITILPEELVYHSIVSGFVSSCDVEDINMYKQNYIVYHEGKYLTRKIKELMELAKEIGYRREQTEIADL